MRDDRPRHARAGEQLQLYCGMRTKSCFLIARATCVAVEPVRLDFKAVAITVGARPPITAKADVDAFARGDGFENWDELAAFWDAEHDRPDAWSGVVIFWHRLVLPG